MKKNLETEWRTRMEMSRATKTWWGFDPKKQPFSNTIEEASGLFVWDAFDECVEDVVEAVLKRKFLCLIGPPCAAKSTCWAEAARRLRERKGIFHLASPLGLEPQAYSEPTIYLTLREAIAPESDPLRRMREERAAQCRRMLMRCNDAKQPVVLTINDAHACKGEFLLTLKRLWDNLDGLDRLLSVLLIGHSGLTAKVGQIKEINQRSEVLHVPPLGTAIPNYLQHECARCGLKDFPFDDSALDELDKLRNDAVPEAANDHPLFVNLVAAAALSEAHRLKQRTINHDIITKAVTKI